MTEIIEPKAEFRTLSETDIIAALQNPDPNQRAERIANIRAMSPRHA